MSALFVVTAVGVGISSGCGGKIANGDCEGAVSVSVPDDPTTKLSFATAVEFLGTDPQFGMERAIALVFSDLPAACPAPFITLPGTAIPTTMKVMIITLIQLSSAPVVGTYSVAPNGVACCPNTAEFVIGTLQEGQTYELKDTSPALGGTVTISAYDGQHISGTCSVARGDGTVVATEFDVPFCTSSCG